MKQCKKDVEVTLADGTVIEAVLKVNEFVDEFGDQEKTSYSVGNWSTEHDEDLDEDQQYEFDEKIEDIVFYEKWDFDNAPDVDEDEETEDEEF